MIDITDNARLLHCSSCLNDEESDLNNYLYDSKCCVHNSIAECLLHDKLVQLSVTDND